MGAGDRNFGFRAYPLLVVMNDRQQRQRTFEMRVCFGKGSPTYCCLTGLVPPADTAFCVTARLGMLGEDFGGLRRWPPEYPAVAYGVAAAGS